ncbi:SDR family oxidoreductase [Streptomyces sp. PA03-5A]|nr:SDR family oxidoreductase [Streptomyces sp. PA03-5A]
MVGKGSLTINNASGRPVPGPESPRNARARTGLSVIAQASWGHRCATSVADFAAPGHAAYGALKGAVEVLTLYQAKEPGERGIRVNAIAPGATATDVGGGGTMRDERVRTRISSQVALGRMGEPEDVGAALAALLSEPVTPGPRLEGASRRRCPAGGPLVPAARGSRRSVPIACLLTRTAAAPGSRGEGGRRWTRPQPRSSSGRSGLRCPKITAPSLQFRELCPGSFLRRTTSCSSSRPVT